jgi:hypothetical protein
MLRGLLELVNFREEPGTKIALLAILLVGGVMMVSPEKILDLFF